MAISEKIDWRQHLNAAEAAEVARLEERREQLIDERRAVSSQLRTLRDRCINRRRAQERAA